MKCGSSTVSLFRIPICLSSFLFALRSDLLVTWYNSQDFIRLAIYPERRSVFGRKAVASYSIFFNSTACHRMIFTSFLLDSRGFIDIIEKKQWDVCVKKRGVTRVTNSCIDLKALREACESSKPLDLHKCRECLQSLEEELRATADTAREMDLLRFLANCCMSISRFDLAETYLKQILCLIESGFELPTIDMIYNTLGRIELSRSNFAEAVQHFLKGLQLSEEMGKADNAAGLCMNLSGAYSHLGWQDKSLFYMKKALNILANTDNLSLLHMVKCNYANMLVSEGKLNEALQIKLECIAYYEDQKQLPKVAQEKTILLPSTTAWATLKRPLKQSWNH